MRRTDRTSRYSAIIAADAGPGEQFVLESEVAEYGLDELLALLDGCLRRGGEAAGGNADDVGDATEVTDRVGQHLGPLAAHVGVGGELALEIRRARLGTPGLGHHDLGVREPEQGVQLGQKVCRVGHDCPRSRSASR